MAGFSEDMLRSGQGGQTARLLPLGNQPRSGEDPEAHDIRRGHRPERIVPRDGRDIEHAGNATQGVIPAGSLSLS
jgi:hypothetical protein